MSIQKTALIIVSVTISMGLAGCGTDCDCADKGGGCITDTILYATIDVIPNDVVILDATNDESALGDLANDTKNDIFGETDIFNDVTVDVFDDATSL